MVAILYPRRLRNLLDVTQPQGTGLPDQGVPLLFSSNSSFVIQTIAGGAGGSFSLGASNLGNTLGQTGVTGSRVVLAGIGNITLSQLTDGNGGTISISGAGGGAGFSAGVSGGNTAGDTGATGTRLVLAGGQSITLSQATDANGGTVTISGASTSQSAQTQNRFNLTLSGNTAGVLAQVSSGTLTLAGGNAITLSQNGNAITISGAAQSVQPETQTFIGGVSASDTLYTSGTVRFTGVGGGVTVSSNTGQRVDISVAAPVAQTEQTQSRFNLTISGNTSGAGALISSGVLTLAGGNNITVSQAGNALTISGANVGGAQTGISGIIASDATYTSGTVRFTGVGGGVTVSSNTGQRVDISVAAQTVQTQNMVAVTLSGNTSGAQALISSGTMTLAGGNNITVSQNGNAVTISGPNVGGAQTGISALANSETTYTSGSVTFSALGALTIRSTTGQHFQFSVDPQSVQSLGMYALGNTTGQSSSTTMDARTLSVRGDGIVSVGYSNGSLRISASQSVQPETQTFIAGLANSQTTYTSGTVSLSELGAITIRSTTGNQFQLSVAAQTAESQSIGMSNIGNTSGTTGIASGAQVRFLLAGGNNITLSQSLNGASGTITISAFNQSAQTQNLHNVTLSGNTAGVMAQISSGTMTLAGGNNITLSQNGNAVTISGPNTAAQSVQTLGMYAVQNTTGQSSSTTMDARTLSVAGDGAVSVGYSAGSLRISAPVQTVESQSIGMSNVGNTSGTTGMASGGQVRFVFAGGNNITLSQSLNGASGTITISAPNLGAGAMSAGVSNLGNSAGATGITGTQLVLVGSNNITLSQTTGANGGTVSIIGGAGGGFSAGASNLGNTAGNTGITGTQLVLVGTNAISLSQTTGANGGTLSIDAPATSSLVGTGNITISTNGSTISIGDSRTPLEFWDNMVPGASTTLELSNAGLQIFPLTPANAGFPGYMSASSVFFDMSGTVSTAAGFTRSLSLAFYTLVNSTQLSRLYSASTSWGTNAGNMNINDSMGGRRWVTLHSSQFDAAPNFHEGSDYYMAVWARSSGGTQTFNFQGQLLPYATGIRSGFMSAASATNTTLGQYPFLGVYSVSFSTGMPAVLAASDINKSVATAISLPRIIFNNVGSNIV